MKIEFNEGFTDNAAFQDGFRECEIARILRAVANKVESGAAGGTMHDINGNKVGEWKA